MGKKRKNKKTVDALRLPPALGQPVDPATVIIILQEQPRPLPMLNTGRTTSLTNVPCMFDGLPDGTYGLVCHCPKCAVYS